MFAIASYISLIVALNVAFAHFPPFDIGIGLWTPVCFFVGLIFIARDYAQRAVGHWVLVAMLVGGVLSYIMANPFVAIASVLAFSVSEVMDWTVYSLTKKPFYKRVVISSIIATPIDSFIFLVVVGIFTPGTFFLMVLSKMITAGFIYWRGRYMDEARREYIRRLVR